MIEKTLIEKSKETKMKDNQESHTNKKDSKNQLVKCIKNITREQIMLLISGIGYFILMGTAFYAHLCKNNFELAVVSIISALASADIFSSNLKQGENLQYWVSFGVKFFTIIVTMLSVLTK